MIKPLLASDWYEDKLCFPLIAQPKIDGVRGLNMGGVLTGRSLKHFRNVHVMKQLSHQALIGFDGEISAEVATHHDLCRLTTSALTSQSGEPEISWWLFDYVTSDSVEMPYFARFAILQQRITQAIYALPHLRYVLKIVPSKWIMTIDELLAFDAENLKNGYEGTVIRDPNAPHREGRSGKKPVLWRIKRFVDFEFRVHTLIEGDENQNTPQINELGKQFRSSHQENKIPNSMIGAMMGTVIGQVNDPSTGRILFRDGDQIKVGAGCLSHEQRVYFFACQDDFMCRIHKGKFFPKGVKDKPRFPTWQTFRDEADT